MMAYDVGDSNNYHFLYSGSAPEDFYYLSVLKNFTLLTNLTFDTVTLTYKKS
jgi:hypothetical protein